MVPSVEHLCEAFEWILNVLGLKSAYLEEFEADALGKCETVLRSHRDSVFNIDFVGDDHSHERPALVVLLDALQPLSQKVECIGVGYVINQHDQVCLTEKLESDLLEDVLTGNVDEVELDTLI